MAGKEEVVDTSDYKIDKNGKKFKAHRIVFNNGQDDGKKGISEMKKKFNSFVEHHTLPLTEEELAQLETELNEVLGKDAKSGDWVHDFVHSDNPKFAGKSKEKRKQMALAAYYSAQKNEAVQLKGGQVKLDKNKNGKLDAEDFKKLRKEELELEEGWDDMLAHAKKVATTSKSSTATKHDVKKTSTGTVYTKQRDADGVSKEFKRDPDQAKRGRGRPKKSSFSEAVEFLMSLTEEQFDDVTSEGFDIFFESFENTNK